jgi:hypothetical protein
MFKLWDYHEVDFTHTFETESGEVFHNTLDHILALRRDEAMIESAGVLHHIENMSDHEPIYAVIKVEHTQAPKDDDEPLGKPKPSWRAATADQKLEFNDILLDGYGYSRICQDM